MVSKHAEWCRAELSFSRSLDPYCSTLGPSLENVDRRESASLFWVKTLSDITQVPMHSHSQVMRVKAPLPRTSEIDPKTVAHSQSNPHASWLLHSNAAFKCDLARVTFLTKRIVLPESDCGCAEKPKRLRMAHTGNLLPNPHQSSSKYVSSAIV